MSTSIEGRISIEVNFADSVTASGVQSQKKIQLVDAKGYTTGKAAIVTGTVGTAAVFLSFGSLGYLDASGSVVAFASVNRLAAKASRNVAITGDGGMKVPVTDSCVSVAGIDPSVADGISVTPYYTAGTASYTLVLYGT